MTEQQARDVAWFIRHTIAEAEDCFPSAPDMWVRSRVASLAGDLERDPKFALDHLAWLRGKYGEVPA